ncbi:hypothetical protein HPB48_021256 [Haemaphysalis longicornis]|uniref:Uncharacterized protein n=1 Tax=Haemaphysalis longicornis TaxID=44386 RepID=A0A9J6G1R9_HAELO|nr:hypothetical protein HPB48_021256 [Haemaphysalis longicornis]
MSRSLSLLVTCRTWSDREIRTLVTHLFDLPVDLANTRQVEQLLAECAHNFTPTFVPPTPAYERYADSKLLRSSFCNRSLDRKSPSFLFFLDPSHPPKPTITKTAVSQCEPLLALLRKVSHSRPANRFETVKDEDYVFRMLNNNASRVLMQLDELRREPK